MKLVLESPGSSEMRHGLRTFKADLSAEASAKMEIPATTKANHRLRPSFPRNPFSPTSDPVQRRLQSLPAKSKFLVVVAFLLLATSDLFSNEKITRVTVTIPEEERQISPLIYGQMYEHVNDPMVYDGVVNKDGSERPHVTKLLSDLDIPVLRWPGGTLVHEYFWENGTGPLNSRKEVYCKKWKNYDNNRFGTDEFLAHCQKIGTTPYINFNMSNADIKGNTLSDALNWMQYVLGEGDTKWGSKRVANGRKEPYRVEHWGIGNENYGEYGVSKKETAEAYSLRLAEWASTIKKQYPQVSLLGVGKTGDYDWNREVVERAGKDIDWITLHIYMHTIFNKGKIEKDPRSTLFAPVRAKNYLNAEILRLKKYNNKYRNSEKPIRISIDEWNNRHKVRPNGTTRLSPRCQIDVAAVAGMLNTFIHHSPYIGMGNYIFPVNSHGLIKTVGDDKAYKTPVFYVFQEYRKLMRGKVADVQISGPSVSGGFAFAVTIKNKFSDKEKKMTYIDSVAAVSEDEKQIVVSLVNRSHQSIQEVSMNLPEGYEAVSMYKLESSSIYATNTLEKQTVSPVETREVSFPLQIKPCGLVLVTCRRK